MRGETQKTPTTLLTQQLAPRETKLHSQISSKSNKQTLVSKEASIMTVQILIILIINQMLIQCKYQQTHCKFRPDRDFLNKTTESHHKQLQLKIKFKAKTQILVQTLYSKLPRRNN